MLIHRFSIGVLELNFYIITHRLAFYGNLSQFQLAISSSFWHWSYWDLKVFILNFTSKLSLDLVRIFGIHLFLASLLCFGFGIFYLSRLFGPGFWTSDSLGLVGAIRQVKPIYSIIGLSSFCFGSIPANHISAGFSGFVFSFTDSFSILSKGIFP